MDCILSILMLCKIDNIHYERVTDCTDSTLHGYNIMSIVYTLYGYQDSALNHMKNSTKTKKLYFKEKDDICVASGQDPHDPFADLDPDINCLPDKKVTDDLLKPCKPNCRGGKLD